MIHKLQASELSALCVTTMTDWWFDRFIDKDQYKDNGSDDFQSRFAGILSGKLADKFPVAEHQRGNFNEAFTAALVNRLPCAHGSVDFGADYHPAGILREAMEMAGIDFSRCPIKTRMQVGHEVQGSGVYLSHGYGSRYEFVCDLQGMRPTKRRVCEFIKVYPETATHGGHRMEESRHEMTFHAYDERAWEEFMGDDNWDQCPEDRVIKSYKVLMETRLECKAEGQAWLT